MKIFIWERVGQCSGNYHSEGGWTETRKTDVIEIFDKIVKDYNQLERKLK